MYASLSNGRPTFLNLGKRHPDGDRFTIVIWGRNRSKFPSNPESYYLNEMVCVTGTIKMYKGVPQIEAKQRSQIKIGN